MRAARHTIAIGMALLGLAVACSPGSPAVAQDELEPLQASAERPRERRPRPSEAATPVPPSHARAARSLRPAAGALDPAPRRHGREERAGARHGARRLGAAARAVARARPQDARGAAGRASTCRRARRPCISCGGACCCPRPRRPPARPTTSTSWRCGWRRSTAPGCWPTWTRCWPRTRHARPHRADPARARATSASARRDAGCQAITALAAPSSGLPGRLKGETQLLAGYCAAAAGDAQAAGLAAELAREEGIEAELPLAVLAGFAAGAQAEARLARARAAARLPVPGAAGPGRRRADLRQGRAGAAGRAGRRRQADARLQIAAAEAALRLNALPPEAVAEVYRRQSLAGAGGADPAAQSRRPDLRRALFFQAVEAARAPAQRRASCAPCSTMPAGPARTCRRRA